MNKIRYIFKEQVIWGPISNFISTNYQTVNSPTTLKSFIKNLGSASNDSRIIRTTSSVAKGVEAAFSLADQTQSFNFFSKTFSFLSQNLVKLSDHFTENVLPVDIIVQRVNTVQLFTRKFIVLVMFAGFLGLFPNGIFHNQTPGLDFSGFFKNSRPSGQQLSCFLSYFNTIADKMATNDPLVNDLVVFERHHRVSSQESFFTSSSGRIHPITLISGYMETYNPGGHVVEAIFGNKHIGSATLSNVMHQEEIMMSLAPETLISRIFHTDLHDEDVLSFRGVMKFSSYRGYGSNNFVYIPVKEEEIYMPLLRVYVSIDALSGESRFRQFTMDYALRELNKLLPVLCTDFFGESEETVRSPFVTGYWGGGVFGGDIEYKFVIQLIASCVCNRPMVFSDAMNKLIAAKIKQLETKYTTCGQLANAFFKLNRSGRLRKENTIAEMLK